MTSARLTLRTCAPRLERVTAHDPPPEASPSDLDPRRDGTAARLGPGTDVDPDVSGIRGLDHSREGIPCARMLYRMYA